jgi:hypothetical protein
MASAFSFSPESRLPRDEEVAFSATGFTSGEPLSPVSGKPPRARVLERCCEVERGDLELRVGV